MNVKNILCPVDYSESGNAAITYASSLAKEYDAEIHLVHIYDLPLAYVDGGFASAPIPSVPPADLDGEQSKLNAVTPTSGVKYRHRLVVGSPVDELVKYVTEQNIDLIVMGTHGRTGLGRLLMGSVAEGVVRRASCPVLTIKQPAETLQASQRQGQTNDA